MATQEEAVAAVEQLTNMSVPADYEQVAESLPEAAADGSGQWLVAHYRHSEKDMSVELWLLSAGVVQPFFDGYDHPCEAEWGYTYNVDKLDRLPTNEQ